MPRRKDLQSADIDEAFPHSKLWRETEDYLSGQAPATADATRVLRCATLGAIMAHFPDDPNCPRAACRKALTCLARFDTADIAAACPLLAGKSAGRSFQAAATACSYLLEMLDADEERRLGLRPDPA